MNLYFIVNLLPLVCCIHPKKKNLYFGLLGLTMEASTDTMNEEKILHVYQELIANPAKLQEGQRILASLMIAPGNFATQSVELLVSPHLDVRTRIYIGALLRNVLKEGWIHETLLQSQKNVTPKKI
jgi:hypothetical protein